MKKETLKPLRHDLLLILFGAIISFSASIVTQIFNYSEQNKQKKFDRKLIFYEKFSTQFGERLFISWELFKGVRDYDTAKISNYYRKFIEQKENEASKGFYYSSLLTIDFGYEMKEKFISFQNGDGLCDSLILFGNEIIAQLKLQTTKIKKDSAYNFKRDKWKINVENQYARIHNKADTLFKLLYKKLTNEDKLTLIL